MIPRVMFSASQRDLTEKPKVWSWGVFLPSPHSALWKTSLLDLVRLSGPGRWSQTVLVKAKHDCCPKSCWLYERGGTKCARCLRLLVRRVVVVADIVMLWCDLLRCFPCLAWLYLPIPRIGWMGKCVQLGVDMTFETQTQGHVKNACYCFDLNQLWKCKKMKGFCWLANACMCILFHAISIKTPGNELRVWGFGKENELPMLKAAKLSSRQQYATACEALLGGRETEEHRGQCY